MTAPTKLIEQLTDALRSAEWMATVDSLVGYVDGCPVCDRPKPGQGANVEGFAEGHEETCGLAAALAAADAHRGHLGPFETRELELGTTWWRDGVPVAALVQDDLLEGGYIAVPDNFLRQLESRFDIETGWVVRFKSTQWMPAKWGDRIQAGPGQVVVLAVVHDAGLVVEGKLEWERLLVSAPESGGELAVGVDRDARWENVGDPFRNSRSSVAAVLEESLLTIDRGVAVPPGLGVGVSVPAGAGAYHLYDGKVGIGFPKPDELGAVALRWLLAQAVAP